MHVNLLPQSLRTKTLLRRGLRCWSLVWGSIVVVLALGGLRQWRSTHELASRLTVLEEGCRPLREMQQHSKQLAAQRQALTQRDASFRGLTSDGKALRLLGLLSQYKRAAADAFQIQSITATPLTPSPASAAARKPATDAAGSTAGTKGSVEAAPPELWMVALKGVAAGDDAVNDLVGALRDSNRFERVELKSIVQYPAAGPQGREWSLECHF